MILTRRAARRLERLHRVLHRVVGQRQEAAQPHDLRLELLDLLSTKSRTGTSTPRSFTSKPLTSSMNVDDVLADVVDVALDRADDDLAELLGRPLARLVRCGLTTSEIGRSISPARISSGTKQSPCLKALADDAHRLAAVVQDLQSASCLRPASPSPARTASSSRMSVMASINSFDMMFSFGLFTREYPAETLSR